MRKEEKIKEVEFLLSMAGNAHHSYEKKVLNGRADEQWAEWYADYLIGHGIDNVIGDRLAAEILTRFLLETERERLSDATRLNWTEFAARKLVDTF
jgi:hypothetical protein